MDSAGQPDAHEAVITLEAVTKRFMLDDGREIQALDPIDLSIARGEFLSVLGPSGCGKSTVLRLIAGLEEASSGSVFIEGSPPAVLSRAHRLGVAFQDHALLPWLDVAANVALPFRLAHRPVDHERVNELLSLVGLERFADARPSQLSGGMRQRASIARALVLHPDVLLLDEPFGALDAVTRREMNLELMRIWSDQKITTLLVTHSVDEALFLGDRVVVMEGRPGKILRKLDVPFARPRIPDLMREAAFRDLSDQLATELEPRGDAS